MVERLKRKQQQMIKQKQRKFTGMNAAVWLTLAATADVQQARLSAGTEAFIGGIICSVCKQGFRGNEPKQRDTFHLAWTLVNQLKRSVGGGDQNICKSAEISDRDKSQRPLPAGIWAVKGQCALLGHEGRPHLSSCAINHVALRSPPVAELWTKQRVKNRKRSTCVGA